MMQKNRNYEMIYIPTSVGMIKVYVYGFQKAGKPGRVFIMLNHLKVNGSGLHKKETIIHTLSKLNSIMNRQD